MENVLDLTGKVALITGGSRGLGAQMARDYAKNGADVVVVSRNKEACEEVAHEVTQMNRRAIALSADVTKMRDIQSMLKTTIDEFGKLDILVNNAGANATNPVLEATEEEWDFIYNINLKALYFCSQQAAKVMIPQKSGKIINISSIGGSRAYRNIAAYGASKAAVMHLTRTFSNEWARYNILVNSIAPGLIATDINKDDLADPKVLDRMLKMIPLRRLGQPSDISAMALFLASDVSNYITGQTFIVDGGKSVE
ncbi:SDR family NAD(P)-dependent oxidoreductase [Bacillus dakarensis]|uniref:SDR family NAD(P)-dependent oxidoreductase n=1 Tax=Robertmurraya dakarensis TaxID=1926278 RepID=UPI0009817A08|nr:glucose 1-dehydrogenase [Bacillus dakarensis]